MVLPQEKSTELLNQIIDSDFESGAALRAMLMQQAAILKRSQPGTLAPRLIIAIGSLRNGDRSAVDAEKEAIATLAYSENLDMTINAVKVLTSLCDHRAAKIAKSIMNDGHALDANQFTICFAAIAMFCSASEIRQYADHPSDAPAFCAQFLKALDSHELSELWGDFMRAFREKFAPILCDFGLYAEDDDEGCRIWLRTVVTGDSVTRRTLRRDVNKAFSKICIDHGLSPGSWISGLIVDPYAAPNFAGVEAA
jgi:hypothetical protein